MGCKHRVGKSPGHVSKITDMGLPKKGKKTNRLKDCNKRECTPVTINIVVQESLPTSFEMWQV